MKLSRTRAKNAKSRPKGTYDLAVLSLALAALSGLVWGVGDFAGGKATQTTPALTVTLTSKINCLPFLAIYLVVLYVPVVPASLPWGAAGGFCGVLGLVVFYRAMSAGVMTVVAPVTAVVSALLPVIAGLASGERPGAGPAARRRVRPGRDRPGLRGACSAWFGPGLVTPRLVGLAALGGAGFGLFFILPRSRLGGHGDSGLWPILAAQLTAIAAVGLLVVLVRPPGGRPRGTVRRPGPWSRAPST